MGQRHPLTVIYASLCVKPRRTASRACQSTGPTRTRFWLADDYTADWGDGAIQLTISAETGHYRLRAYVQFTGTEEISYPTDTLAASDAGHFVAHFSGGDC